MDRAREVAKSYGLSFDELVEAVGRAMAAAGYPSRHAPAPSIAGSSYSDLLDSVIGLGFLCAKLETALSGPFLPGRNEVTGQGILSIYAAARRLVLLFRFAQRDSYIDGIAAAEVDGEVDTLEEAVLRMDNAGAIIEASRDIVSTSLRFRDVLPAAILGQVLELRNLLVGLC